MTAISEELSAERLQAIIESCGVPNRAGVYHATNERGDLTLDREFARTILTELQSLRSGNGGEVSADFWAVWAPSGAHIGTWSDQETALRVAQEYRDCSIVPLFRGRS